MPLTTYVANEVLTASSLNANFNYAVTVPVAPATAIFNETQASGTEGGTFTSGSYVKRTLNTTVVNTITSCTLTSSVISLPAGTYQVTSFVPCFNVANNKSRLRNTTAGTDIAMGTSMYAPGGTVTSKVQTTFTLASTANIELQHRCSTTGTTNGFGVASGYSDSEVYSTIQITKTA